VTHSYPVQMFDEYGSISAPKSLLHSVNHLCGNQRSRTQTNMSIRCCTPAIRLYKLALPFSLDDKRCPSLANTMVTPDHLPAVCPARGWRSDACETPLWGRPVPDPGRERWEDWIV
jgi:hypothetical protein